MCGENFTIEENAEKFLGSPPRVRGKLALRTEADIYVRITPACAGKTDYEYKGRHRFGDHPRVCGENK